MPSYIVKNAYGDIFGSIELEAEPRIGDEIDCSINGIYEFIECKKLSRPVRFGDKYFTESIRVRFKRDKK